MSNVALVLCGGKGTRFSSISKNPKIMAPFRGQLFLDWLIFYLRAHDFDKIVLSVGYRQKIIRNYVETLYNDSVDLDLLSESFPLGTGGAIKNFFDTYSHNSVCVLNGDTFFSKKLPMKKIQNKTSHISCLCKQLTFNDRFGSFSNISGSVKITRGTKKIPLYDSNVFCGVARISRYIDWRGLSEPFSTEELISAQKKYVKLIQYEGEFLDFGVADDYEKLQSF